MGILDTIREALKLAEEKAAVERLEQANRFQYPKQRREALWATAYQEYLQDIAWYGEHFRGPHGRVEPWQVWTLDKGQTWIHAPTGEQVTRFCPGALP